MKSRLFALFIVLCATALPGSATLKIYYLRHAQSGGNVTKDWEKTPPAQRPPYVGNADTFSPLGWKQAAAVPEVLAPYHFDLIAVSGLWRTRNTIRPYLLLNNRTADIWPELCEFGNTGDRLSFLGRSDLPAPALDLATSGPLLKFTGEEADLFHIRPDSPRAFDFPRGGAEGAADLTQAMKIVIDRIHREFGGTDKSILLVGHGTAGRHLLHYLTGDDYPLKTGLQNAGLWLAEEQPNGTFRLTLANSAPIPPQK